MLELVKEFKETIERECDTQNGDDIRGYIESGYDEKVAREIFEAYMNNNESKLEILLEKYGIK